MPCFGMLRYVEPVLNRHKRKFLHKNALHAFAEAIESDAGLITAFDIYAYQEGYVFRIIGLKQVLSLCLLRRLLSRFDLHRSKSVIMPSEDSWPICTTIIAVFHVRGIFL